MLNSFEQERKMTRDEIQKVRDALAYYGHSSVSRPATIEAIAILDAALAAPEQEPVAWRYLVDDGYNEGLEYSYNQAGDGEPLYTAPPAAKEWVGLTEQRSMYFGLTHDGTWLSISQEHYERLKPEGRLKVYEAPPSRKWQGLTRREHIHLMTKYCGEPTSTVICATDVFLREKNHG